MQQTLNLILQLTMDTVILTYNFSGLSIFYLVMKRWKFLWTR